MNILAIDEGTSSTRAMVYDEHLKTLGKAQFEIKSHHQNSGWVEQDALEIWEKTFDSCQKAIENAGLSWQDISGIGITNQRETTVIWDKETGKPIHHAIVWQSKQSLSICNQWKKQGYEAKTLKKTGLPIDPYFSASKIKWLLDQYDPKRQIATSGKWLAGTIDTWLMWKLSGGKLHATDTSNASRTLLFNIRTLKWDTELCALFNIPMQLLPQVINSTGKLGITDSYLTEGNQIPINATNSHKIQRSSWVSVLANTCLSCSR
jgi:glycerol kinase